MIYDDFMGKWDKKHEKTKKIVISKKLYEKHKIELHYTRLHTHKYKHAQIYPCIHCIIFDYIRSYVRTFIVGSAARSDVGAFDRCGLLLGRIDRML